MVGKVLKIIGKILKYTWFPLLILAGYLWFVTPVTFIKGTDAADISYILLFDGNTGDELKLEDPKDISYIVDNVHSIPVKREGIAFLNMGYRFRMTFFAPDGTELTQFTINAEDTLRGEFFYYITEEGGLCFDYLWHLMDEAYGYI